jgi:hypothetical protein
MGRKGRYYGVWLCWSVGREGNGRDGAEGLRRYTAGVEGNERYGVDGRGRTGRMRVDATPDDAGQREERKSLEPGRE